MKKVAAVTLIFVLIAGAAFAQDHIFGGSRMGGPNSAGLGRKGGPCILAGLGRLLSGGPLMRVMSRLGLSEEQQKKIEAIHEETLLKSIDLGAILLKDSIRFKSLMKTDAPDVKEVEKLIDDMAARGAELGKAVAGALIRAKAELSPEQREKVEQLLKKPGRRGGKTCKFEGRGRGKGPRTEQRQNRFEEMNRERGERRDSGRNFQHGRDRGRRGGHAGCPFGMVGTDSFDGDIDEILDGGKTQNSTDEGEIREAAPDTK